MHTAPVRALRSNHSERTRQTNPEHPACHQPIPLAVGRSQIDRWLVEPRRAVVGERPEVAPESVVLRTIDYVTGILRSGIYVLVLDGAVRLYVPFTAGPEFRNAWGDQLDLPERRPEGLADPRHWWTNASILCTKPTPDLWGASFVAAYRPCCRRRRRGWRTSRGG